MSLTTKLIIILIIVVFLDICLQILFKSPIVLGRRFERSVAKSLLKLERKGIYGKVLRNVYLPKNEYETSEIDVLYITTKGLFVIECKNYNGWIFGRENATKWTVSLPQGKGKSRKYHFYNPLKQNASHIKPLNSFLLTIFPDKNINIFPMVIFSLRGTLKDVTNNSSQPVFVIRDLEWYFNQAFKPASTILTEVQVDELYEKLRPLTQVDKEVKKQHKKNIQEKYK